MEFMEIDKKLHNEIKEYCKLNNLKMTEYVIKSDGVFIWNIIQDGEILNKEEAIKAFREICELDITQHPED